MKGNKHLKKPICISCKSYLRNVYYRGNNNTHIRLNAWFYCDKCNKVYKILIKEIIK